MTISKGLSESATWREDVQMFEYRERPGNDCYDEAQHVISCWAMQTA